MTPEHDLSREEVAAWVCDNIVGDLRTLELGIKKYEGAKARQELPAGMGGGNFLLAVGCLMALEYFGWIYTGDKKSIDSTRAYIRRFFGDSAPGYLGVWDLLWPSLRHGIVHGGWPKKVQLEGDDQRTLLLGVGNTMEDPHLQCAPGKPGTFVLSAPVLLGDLEKSARLGFRNWILQTATKNDLKRAQPQVHKVKRYRDSEEAQFRRLVDG